MDQETHTYVVQQNKYTITKSGEVKQIGGDWYNLYTSIGEVRIPGDLIKKLVKASKSAHEIEAEGKKINDSFKLSGACILKRGTPFGDTVVYVEDIDNGKAFDEDDEALVEELQNLTRTFEEQTEILNETQERFRSVSKRILSRKKNKKR